jgi:hypothetical protein
MWNGATSEGFVRIRLQVSVHHERIHIHSDSVEAPPSRKEERHFSIVKLLRNTPGVIPFISIDFVLF